MDARNQAKAEQDNVRMSTDNYERRIRDQESGSRRRLAWFALGGGVVGLLIGLTTGPAGGWHHPDLSDRLANGGGFAFVGAVVGWRLWSAFGIEKD
jgi:hypothetical protein